MDWTNIAVRSIVAVVAALGFFAILWAAKRQGKTEQALKDQLAGEKTKAEIVENSNASAEAADTRSDPTRHADPAIVSGDAVPGWLRRD